MAVNKNKFAFIIPQKTLLRKEALVKNPLKHISDTGNQTEKQVNNGKYYRQTDYNE
jgi:hypothetical protein